MNKKAILAGMIGMIALVTQTQAIVINGTGNNGTGAEGTIDQNYTLVDESGEQALIQYEGTLIGGGNPWVANLPTGKWISPVVEDSSTAPWGTDRNPYWYIFRTEVMEDGSVSGRWSTDNGGYITVGDLDGTRLCQTSAGPDVNGNYGEFSYRYYTPFTLNNLVAGQSVYFHVQNLQLSSGNPAGLLVAVPDGGLTAMMLGMATMALGWMRRRAI